LPVNDERRPFETLLDVLDRVIARADAMHSPAHDFGTGVPLYRTEIHTIRAIGENPRINVTSLAEHMGVTKGAVSQTVNKLVRKGLARKTGAADNAREVLLELTDAGWTGFHNHERFHSQMFDTAREYYGDRLGPKLESFIAVMNDLNDILDRYEQNTTK
jgi:DNA-binding MarR family transcriptional regulator